MTEMKYEAKLANNRERKLREAKLEGQMSAEDEKLSKGKAAAILLEEEERERK